MKTIGLIGGMSWESTALYYRWINEGVKRQLGGLNSAKIILYSVNFQEIEQLQRQGQWTVAGDQLADAARKLEQGGAELLLICTNTMHIVAEQVQSAINIPLLHLADATAQRIRAAEIDTVGLLGTAFTMEQNFYKGRLNQHGLQVIVPDTVGRETVHKIIYEELCQGIIDETSRQAYLDIIQQLKADGAQAIIAGCTEITLLVQQHHTDIALYDTTAIHAEEAVRIAIADS